MNEIEGQNGKFGDFSDDYFGGVDGLSLAEGIVDLLGLDLFSGEESHWNGLWSLLTDFPNRGEVRLEIILLLERLLGNNGLLLFVEGGSGIGTGNWGGLDILSDHNLFGNSLLDGGLIIDYILGKSV